MRSPLSLPDKPGDTDFRRALMEDPFSVRGPHEMGAGIVVRAFLPGADSVDLLEGGEAFPMQERESGLFVVERPERRAYGLRIKWPEAEEETEDPFSFGPVLGDIDLYLFSEGSHWKLAEKFGACPITHEGIEGVSFAVWAPNARRVSVVGHFNTWDGRRHPMRLRHSAGIWEIFIPRLRVGETYKYEIVAHDGGILPLKADPLARQTEAPPATASVIAPLREFEWHDQEWMSNRARAQSHDAPVSIYEVHASSWKRPDDAASGTLTWIDLSRRLVAYAKEVGFTHIELLPIMEHPFTGSWGYQPLSQFAPTSRLGSPAEFAHFVDACHVAGLGVILDWVPAHFPSDAHGLARFDGTALYEHTDPKEGFHPDWNTYVFNLGRNEVQGFLIASALWWIERFHVDGIRVDAVASMLYRDYSRRRGEWIPNRYGGRENLEAIAFLRRLNTVIRERGSGVITIAEESTSWPGVSHPVEQGGLGFSYKWNMGWMHDTLQYVGREPIHRKWHHEDITFGMLYAFAENFILPLSHDEVVYGKGSLYRRAPGDEWQKLATLRAYFAFMWTYPGKKLLFMGDEFGARDEWYHDGTIDWTLLGDKGHLGIKSLITDLNRLYAREPSLHRSDCDPKGFQWLVVDDRANSIYAYARLADGDARPLIVVFNMTPEAHQGYALPAPRAGTWREIFNSDSDVYGGTNTGNLGAALETRPGDGHDAMLEITVPPLGTAVFGFEG